MNPLQENTGENLCNLGLSNISWTRQRNMYYKEKSNNRINQKTTKTKTSVLQKTRHRLGENMCKTCI